VTGTLDGVKKSVRTRYWKDLREAKKAGSVITRVSVEPR
jgi:hypothetical protein